MPLFIFDLTSFQRLGQESKKYFAGILVQMRTRKFAFEINWPLARETKKNLFHYLVRSFLINQNYWKLHNLFGIICQSLKSKPGKLVRVNPVKTQHLRWKILTECHALLYAAQCSFCCCKFFEPDLFRKSFTIVIVSFGNSNG